MRCWYEDTDNKDDCQSLCNDDRNCKGFTILDGYKCQLATTTEPCPKYLGPKYPRNYPYGGRGPVQGKNKGNLDPGATCGEPPSRFGGCFIKNAQGTHLLLVISQYGEKCYLHN